MFGTDMGMMLDRILFLDIETVPCAASMGKMSEEMQELWRIKFAQLQGRMPERYTAEQTPEEGFACGAGVYAEFAKVACISVGFVYMSGTERRVRLKSFCGDNEKTVLEGFAALVNKFMVSKDYSVCGHNIKEFDMPFIMRRMLVNGIRIPAAINVMGRKPWETNFIDTMEMWKFGDFKSFTSLRLLAALFGVPSPKDDIDGSQVADVYYREHDLKRIATYCQKDVLTTIQIYLRMNGEAVIAAEAVEYV